MSIEINEKKVEHIVLEDLSEEIYQDFLSMLDGRELTVDVLAELSLEYSDDVLKSCIDRLNIYKKNSRKKGSVIANCKRNFVEKYPYIKYFELYKSEKNTQLLGIVNTTKMCLVLNDQIIKNNQYNDFLNNFISDDPSENTAEKIYYKIESCVDSI